MTDHFAVTVTDASGSRHFKIKKSIKRQLAGAGLVVAVLVGASATWHVMQAREISRLVGDTEQLEQELVQFDQRLARLDQRVANRDQSLAEVGNELVELERYSGVDITHEPVTLVERVRSLAEYQAIKVKLEAASDFEPVGDVAPGRAPHFAELDNLTDVATQVEAALLNESQDRILHDSIPNGFPIVKRVVTSPFGYRLDPITGARTYHRGVDLRAKDRVDVFATADGIVKAAEFTELGGNRVIIQHNLGFESRYAHLDSMDVKAGDIIHKGEKVGLSGNSGRSVAPHLHYEIRYLGKAIDPTEFLEWEYGDHDIFTQVRGVKWQSLISLINKQITHQTLQLSLLEPGLRER